MKVRNFCVIVIILNLISTSVLIYGFKNPYFLSLLLLNLWVLIKTRWSRFILLFLLYLSLILMLLGLTYSLIRIEEIRRLLVVAGSLLFSGVYVIYSLFVFSSPSAKAVYKKQAFYDEDASEGWICPKCSNKMLFSIACWNCGFNKAELNKPDQPKKNEADRIESYLKKKRAEGEIGNA